MTPPKLSYKRSDVILVLFPNSNLRTAKTRPALVVQADNLQTGLSQVIVAMVTSRVFRANQYLHLLGVTLQLSSVVISFGDRWISSLHGDKLPNRARFSWIYLVC